MDKTLDTQVAESTTHAWEVRTEVLHTKTTESAPSGSLLSTDRLLFMGKLMVFLWLCRKPPFLAVDSQSYLEHHVLRTPGYPLFLDLMRLLSAGYFLKLAQVVQIFFGVLAAHGLAGGIMRVLGGNLDRGAAPKRKSLAEGALEGTLFFLLAVPLFRCGDVIITETLSYAAFLLLNSQLLVLYGAVEQKNKEVSAARGAVGIALSLLLLLLLRPQFLFLLPLALVLCCALSFYGFFRDRRQLKRASLVLVFGVGLAVSLSALGQAAYNAANHGIFSRIPATGIQLLSVHLYLADPDLKDLFPRDSEEGRFLGSLQNRMEERRLALRHRAEETTQGAHFNQVYNAICYGTIVGEYQDLLGKSRLSPLDWVALDRLTVRISVALYKRQALRVFSHMAKGIKEAGGYLPLYMVILAGFSLSSLWHRRSAIALFVLSVCLMGLANYVLVAMVEPLGTRYLLYTENLQPAALMGFVGFLLKRSS